MDLDNVISLADAAEQLGLAQSTLRNQAVAGRLRARLVGKTWITTRDEVERYRLEHRGQVGRPANILAQPPAFEDVLGKPGEANILDRRGAPVADELGRRDSLGLPSKKGR